MKEAEKAVQALKSGSFILIHDSEGRENETDMVCAAEKITPAHITRMRNDGGGLICVAINRGTADSLGLPFMHDIYRQAREKIPLLAEVEADDIPYDEKSSFSITVNHRKTFTGITDVDRALTIAELAYLARAGPSPKTLGLNFRSPGHVHLLISSGLESRSGHTELSEAFLSASGLTGLAVICEMMDDETGRSLPPEKARAYARKNSLVFLESNEVKDFCLKKDG